MPVLVMDPMPGQIDDLIAERERLGLDRRDEVWEGVLHLVPPASHKHEQLVVRLGVLLSPIAEASGLDLTGSVGIGEGQQDFRVPDLVLHRPGWAEQWHLTAAQVIEILSPGDRGRQKFGFYAAHEVDEVVLVDPDTRSVEWLALSGDSYEPVDRSSVIELGPAELADRLDWPS